MQTSNDLGRISAALVSAQENMRNAGKDRQNPQLRNRYATLESCIDSTRPALAAAGLAIIQGIGNVTASDVVRTPGRSGSETMVERRAGTVTVTTRLVHTSGEWMQSELVMPWAGAQGINDSQAVGIAITYARRYALMAMCGIVATDEDTDGDTSGRQPDVVRHEREPAREATTQPATPDLATRRERARARLDSLGRLAEAVTACGPVDGWTAEQLDGPLRAIASRREPGEEG